MIQTMPRVRRIHDVVFTQSSHTIHVLSPQAADAAKKARELVRRKNVLTRTMLPGKLADCTSEWVGRQGSVDPHHEAGRLHEGVQAGKGTEGGTGGWVQWGGRGK